MTILILAFIGGFLGNVVAYLMVFKMWKFPRIVVVPAEKVAEIGKWIRTERGGRGKP